MVDTHSEGFAMNVEEQRPGPLDGPDAVLALDPRFTPVENDPLRIVALLSDEVRQARETGFDVDDLVAQANRTDETDRVAVLALVDRLGVVTERGRWPWDEPSELSEIQDALDDPPASATVDREQLPDRIEAGWLGRIAGCNLGKPLEWGDHWTVSHIESYLRQAGAYPLRDYVPVLEPMPPEFELNESWPHSTRGRIDGSARDDDIDYAILALHMLERYGRGLTPADVAQEWIELLPIGQVYTAERAAYINLVNGLTPPATARHRNPYREWIGAQIRGDVYGYVNPGDPWSAARLAYQDASLSHTGNGIYGGMWAAALVASAFSADTPRAVVETAIRVVPPRSRLADAVRQVLAWHAEGLSWQAARENIQRSYGHYSWVHSINNAAIVTLGLLWGDSDYLDAVGITVMSGLDTDSNAATVGSVMGVLVGTAGLPAHLIEPLHDRTRSALFGFDNTRISDLARRTVSLLGGDRAS